MRTSCINHPKNDRVIIIQTWYVELCGENHCSAFIVGYLHLCHEGFAEPPLFLSASRLRDSILGAYGKDVFKESLQHLENKGLLAAYQLKAEDAKKLLQGKLPASQNTSFDLTCEWCRSKTLILHEHHYPIPKRFGGEDVVSICASCHAEFHYLADTTFYKPTEKLADLFNENPFSEEAIARINGGAV